MGDFNPTDKLEDTWKQLSEAYANDDANTDPKCQVALK